MDELISRLTALKTCIKCEISGKPCDDNCSTQYEAGNMGEIVKTLDMAITALSADGDLISREAVLDIISDVMPIYSDNYHYILEEKINELPTIPQTAIPQEVIDLVIKGLGITVEKLKEMSTEDLVKFAEKQTAIKHNGEMECPNCGTLFYEVPMMETVLEEIKAEIQAMHEDIYELNGFVWRNKILEIIDKHISRKE